MRLQWPQFQFRNVQCDTVMMLSLHKVSKLWTFYSSVSTGTESVTIAQETPVENTVAPFYGSECIDVSIPIVDLGSVKFKTICVIFVILHYLYTYNGRRLLLLLLLLLFVNRLVF